MMRGMDYAEARAAFFTPREIDPAAARPGAAVSPARALRDAIEPIAMICYWSRHANDAYAALGLNFLTGYAWGRASTMGEPGPGVVAAAFGVFEPGLIGDLYTAGRAAATLEQIREARLRGSIEALEEVLGTPAELTETVAALRRAVQAADPTARPLFAGGLDLPWPEHPLGALWHGTTLLREYRGDSHMATCAAAGLSGLEANLLTEMRVGWEGNSYTATRGWSPEAMASATEGLVQRGLVSDGRLSEIGAKLRGDIEEATDMLLGPVLGAVGKDLASLVTTLNDWSKQIVKAGWFPPDPYKRASG